jgi:DNA polymerase-3 subunit beta
MKFSVAQPVMQKALQRVIGAIAPRVPIPSLSNLHFKLDGNELKITSTDLDITINASIELISSEGSGGVLVQAKRFQELIRELPESELEVNIPEPGKVFLKGEGIGSYTIPGGDPADFPELPSVNASLAFTTDADNLKRMISKTIFAVSNDEMRPVLTGLLLQVRPNEVRFVATDGHRLSRMIHTDIEYSGEPRDVIVPMKALNLLMRNLDADDKPELALAETRASFKTGTQTLISRLIDGNYPRYESVIPENNPGRLTANTAEFMAATRRVSIFANQLSKQIRLHIGSNTIRLETEDQELGGQAKEEISVNYIGEPLEIAYNSQYLMGVLKQIDTEEVIFELGGEDDAAIVKPTSQEENEDFLMLLMPIRLR